MNDLITRLSGGALGASLARLLGRFPASIWCLHRFVKPSDPWIGDDVDALARQIQTLMARGVRFVSLADLVDATEVTAPRVAITVDDGYADFASHAWPMFQRLRCPVTVYLTTAPITDTAWFWWDYLEHALDGIQKPYIDIDELGLRVNLTDPALRVKESLQLRYALKQLPDDERRAVLSRVSSLAALEDTVLPPAHMRALHPGQVERLAKDGVDFGAHTVTHPILSRCEPERARWEISESVRTVTALTGRAVTSFAYPNGAPEDFGQREVEAVRLSQVPIAVTTTPRLLSATDDPWRRPRFIFSADAYCMARRTFGYDAVPGEG